MQLTLSAPVTEWIDKHRANVSRARFILKVLEHQMQSQTVPYMGKGITDGQQRSEVCKV